MTRALLFACAGAACACATPHAPLHWKQLTLSPESVEQRILAGPPETAGMRSGRVVLAAGAHMHRHTTGGNEELLTMLQGRAKVRLGEETVELSAGQVLYIPPETPHEVENEGPEEARYVYCVAPAH